MTDGPGVKEVRVGGRKLPRQVAVFGVVSVTTTLLDFGLFNAFVFFGLFPIVLANTISYGSGIAASYLLNKKMTFVGGGRDKRHHEVGLFVLISLSGMLLNNVAVAAAAGIAGGSALMLNAAKLAAGIATWVFKFVTFKRWVYPVAAPSETATEEGMVERS